VTGGQTYTTTTVQPATEKLYSANTGGNVVYTTGPVQSTTYEYVNVPSSSTYVEQAGQRWESSAPYVTGNYEYINYPEGVTYSTQK